MRGQGKKKAKMGKGPGPHKMGKGPGHNKKMGKGPGHQMGKGPGTHKMGKGPGHRMGHPEGSLGGSLRAMGMKTGMAVADLRGGMMMQEHKNPVKYVRSLGHNVVTSLATQTTTTLTVSTTHGLGSEDFCAVIAFMGYTGGNTGSVTCVDSLGNIYTKTAEVTFNSGYIIDLFFISGVHSLAKNAVITVTHPGATRRVIIGDEFRNIAKTGASDMTASAHNTTAATFATSGMTSLTTQDKEILYGVIGVNGPSTDSFKKPQNWSLLHDRGTNASDGNDIRLITQFRTTNSTGTYEVSGTLGTARLWGAITQSFKAEGGASDRNRD